MQSDNLDHATRLTAMFQRGLANSQNNYHPEHNLVGPTWHGMTRAMDDRPMSYDARYSLCLAQALMRIGDENSVAQAEAIIARVLECQECSPHHPHRGNFRWLYDDIEVIDLNAVQFYLRFLLPILIEHDAQLSPQLISKCRECVHMALEEQDRMNVAPTYTNIHIMALYSLLVGGQWLDDEYFQTLGKARWDKWVRFTVQSGAPHEYNSPSYGGIDLSALAVINQHLKDPRICLQARIMYERLWLHLVLHIHRPTNQLGGPYCRCYWDSLMSGKGVVKDLIWSQTGWNWTLESGPYGRPTDTELPSNLELAMTDHWLPEFVPYWINQQQQFMPYEIKETANRKEGTDLTTYGTKSYVLGTASQTYSIGQEDFYIEHQSNYLIAHYSRPNSPGKWGMMYSRYVVNDQHFGTISPAPDRPPNSFFDQGNFAGAQLKNKSIALYSLQPQHDLVSSLKTVIVFPDAKAIDEIWLNDRRIATKDLPQKVAEDDWLVIADGSIYVGIKPLEHSCLGHEAPIVLEQGPNGELWLTIYNYRGPAKRFWDYASLKGAFWKGNIRAGYVVEIVEQTDYESADSFLVHLHQSVIEDSVDSEYMRHVVFSNDGEELSIDYDLWNTEPGERKFNDDIYSPPSLTSPIAMQGDSGNLHLGNTILATNPQPMWLINQESDSTKNTWIAVNPLDEPTPLRWETPLGVITAEQWGLGTLVLHSETPETGTLSIESLTEPIGLQVPDGVSVTFVD